MQAGFIGVIDCTKVNVSIDGATAVVILYPQLPAVGLDDRPRDWQAHAPSRWASS